MSTKEQKEYLKRVYYKLKLPSSLGGVDALYRFVSKQGRHVLSRKDIRSWLRNQDAYTLHKPVGFKYSRNRILVSGSMDQWQGDLVEVGNIAKHNDGYLYLLVIIDIYSKYLWVRPVKTKKADDVTEAMESILLEGKHPRTLQTDSGK